MQVASASPGIVAASPGGSGTPQRKRPRSRLSLGCAPPEAATPTRLAAARPRLSNIGPSGAFLKTFTIDTPRPKAACSRQVATAATATTAERIPTPEKRRRLSLEAEFAEAVSKSPVKPRIGADDTHLRLTTMLAKLAASLGTDLEMGSVLATSTFGDIVSAKTATGEETIVKFSQQKVWQTWDGNSGDNLAMLKKESEGLEVLNRLEGASRHVVRLVHPFCEFEMGLERWGAIVMERGEWDVGAYVGKKLAEGGVEARTQAAHAITAWEDSIGWLHSHGILHLDIKANNAVGFSDGSVKLIDVAGMLGRNDVTPDVAGRHARDLVWDTRELAERGVTMVSALKYRQPNKVRGATLDYGADWWSMAVSKMELLGALPGVDDHEVGNIIWLSLNAGKLDGHLRARVAKALGETDPFCDSCNAWVHSVMCNLQGRPAGVEYIQEAQRVLYMGWKTMYNMES